MNYNHVVPINFKIEHYAFRIPKYNSNNILNFVFLYVASDMYVVDVT